MMTIKTRTCRLAAVHLALLGAWAAAPAQTPPIDSGRILNEIQRSRVPGLPPHEPTAPVIEEAPRPAMKAPAGERFRVNGFRIRRNTVYTEAQLVPLLKDFIGKELDIADLNRAADVVTRYYREHGYFVARAYIPAQEIQGGIVEIVVLEGHADKINVAPAGKVRLADGVVRNTLAAALDGGAIRQDRVERGLLLLDDLPGIDARVALSPGESLGASTLTTQVSEGPLVTGDVDVDNGGNNFSGANRLGATVNLNDPSGRGDQATLRGTHSTGVDYARIAYQIPLGSTGLKVGAAYTDSRYRLCCEFAALDARGKASVATVSATYPFVRSPDFTLRGGLALDNRRFFDSTVVSVTSDRHADVGTASLALDSRDALFGGGLNNAAVAISSGQLHLSNWPSDLAAAENAHSDGGYTKTAYTATRLQRLTERTSLYASLSGQFASKNLDSSEKFVLGGPQGVRAYPVGEAAGDEGAMLNLELRLALTDSLQLAGFLDEGSIRLHRNEWPAVQGGPIPNRYSLAGAGLGLQWSRPGDLVVLASVATTLGSNPGRDANGNDADGTHRHTR